MSIAKKLRQVMDERHISIYALERTAGMKPSVVQNIIYGRSKNPGVDTIKTIAKALNCSVAELIEETNDHLPLFAAPLEPWNLSLFVESLKALELVIKEQSLTISQKDTFSLAQEIYKYAAHSPASTVDLTFVRWLLSKK
ncbi:MAG: helix-turn-helix domain-containing protein [Pseudomonadota bacterium]|jgi:transcriptional regulator with XRE-family HTH domain|nr:helix-turn-helix transcriptional regulator [Alphaproteobacteria bacterium]